MYDSTDLTLSPAVKETTGPHTYPAAYKPRSIREQIYMLRLAFPEIRVICDDIWNAECLANRSPPEGAEAWFAVPAWQRLARTYKEALVKMLKALARAREVREFDIEWCRSDLKSRMLRKNERGARLLQLLRDRQEAPDDILVIPAQLGLLYRNVDISQARDAFRENEFDLDAFTVASILLTHPERLNDEDTQSSLWIDCAGDEVSVNENPLKFSFGLGFGFEWANGEVSISPTRPDKDDRLSAFATGFVPETLKDSDTP